MICKIKDEKSSYLGELYPNCAKHTLSDELNVIRGEYANKTYLRQNFPEINLLTVDSTLQALKSVITDNADAYIGTQVVSLYIIKKHHFVDLKVAAFFEEAKRSNYRIGVIKSKPLLRGIQLITWSD